MGEVAAVLHITVKSLYAICERGLEASPTKELLIEESLLGWKEI
jgi:carbamoyl-phosphate synthase large subunit